MKFIKYLGSAHINFKNVAVYQNGSKIKARVEHVVNGKSIGARDFDSLDALDAWVESIPGSGAGRLVNVMEEIAVK